MRETSNPIFRSLPKQEGGYAQFGSGLTQPQGYPAAPYQETRASRPLTIDDVVTKTGITLAVLTAVAAVSYFMVSANLALAGPLTFIGAFGGLALVMIATFARKQDNPGIVLGYAVLEGMALGAISFLFANVHVGRGGVSAGALISEAILGTIGVFFGMLVVYKTGAIRVTPKFTRMMVAAMFGVMALMIGNIVVGFFNHGEGMGLRNGSGLAIIFSLVCIGIAAFSFLLDFDSADQMIRAGAPDKAAWGIALGLTVTLVWLYLEILRLLSSLQND